MVQNFAGSERQNLLKIGLSSFSFFITQTFTRSEMGRPRLFANSLFSFFTVQTFTGSEMGGGVRALEG